MEIRLLKKGLKIDGKYYSCFYSSSKNNLNGNATIYIRTYERLPEVAHEYFQVENNTDIYTDYFEKDRIRVSPQHELFNRVEELSK